MSVIRSVRLSDEQYRVIQERGGLKKVIEESLQGTKETPGNKYGNETIILSKLNEIIEKLEQRNQYYPVNCGATMNFSEFGKMNEKMKEALENGSNKIDFKAIKNNSRYNVQLENLNAPLIKCKGKTENCMKEDEEKNMTKIKNNNKWIYICKNCVEDLKHRM